MHTEALAPCPFNCPGTPELKAESDGGSPGSQVMHAYVECHTCKARGPLIYDWGNPAFQEHARAGWNERVTVAALA